MTAGGYVDLNIALAKICSCLFVWSVQQGHTATKHIYITFTYVFITQKLHFYPLIAKTCMISMWEEKHFESFFYMYACKLTECLASL